MDLEKILEELVDQIVLSNDDKKIKLLKLEKLLVFLNEKIIELKITIDFVKMLL